MCLQGVVVGEGVLRYVSKMSWSDAGIDAMKWCLFQSLESSLESAMEQANQALNLGDKGSRLMADELEVAADELQKSLESVVSAGLAKSHPLVTKATELRKSLRDMASKTKVSTVPCGLNC